MNGTEHIKPEYKLINAVEKGFWWCNGCMKVTQLEDRNASIMRCARCQSIKIKWCFQGIEYIPELDYQI